MNYDHTNPILGVYYYPLGDWELSQIQQDLDHFAAIHLKLIWLFFDSFYDTENSDKLRALLDYAHSVGLSVIPVLGQFLQLEDYPEVKIVNADGTTSDDPRYWNMGCFRNPILMERASSRSTGFFKDFGDHPALYEMDGLPAMSYVHEAYYRNDVPEFGGDEMHPSCYCEHCRADWRMYLESQGLDPNIEPPVDDTDPVIWRHWLIHHGEAIPEFLENLIQTTKAVQDHWATHELNNFYPASWQIVYTGTDWWQTGRALDFGHEDMYPLEFDTRYMCYVYDYVKDIARSVMGFEGLTTCHGQAFESWLGYSLPENSKSEQVYSALAHGALGLTWWTDLPDGPSEARYQWIKKTAPYNAEFVALVEKLAGYQLVKPRVAVLYSWTTMAATCNDMHGYDTLLAYKLLVQGGHAVDVVTEQQVMDGVLSERGYKGLFVMGCAALPDGVHERLNSFVTGGGLIFADYAPHIHDDTPPAFGRWHTHGESPRTYMLPAKTPVTVQLGGSPLKPPENASVLARFNDETPAVCRIRQGDGTILLFGSYLGWDYTNYPGHYDLGKMFPFHVRHDAALRRFVYSLMNQAGATPPVQSTHTDVEVGLWHTPDKDSYMVFVINHLQSPEQTTVRLPVEDGHEWEVQEALSGAPVDFHMERNIVVFDVALANLQGQAFIINRT